MFFSTARNLNTLLIALIFSSQHGIAKCNSSKTKANNGTYFTARLIEVDKEKLTKNGIIKEILKFKNPNIDFNKGYYVFHDMPSNTPSEP